MKADFIEALNAIEKERGISKDILIDAFESALVAAYKRNYKTTANVPLLTATRETCRFSRPKPLLSTLKTLTAKFRLKRRIR